MDKQSLDFLQKYLETKSPTGYEEEGQKVWLDYLKPYITNFKTDAYNSAVALKAHPTGNTNHTVMLEAHADEISWSVQYISEDGLIYVSRNGGSDEAVARTKDVEVLTNKGEWIKGVIGCPAIHIRGRQDEKTPKVHELYVDVGVDSKERLLEMGVEVGLPVVYSNNFEIIGDYVKSRGVDNRIGGFIIAEVLRRLEENKIYLPFHLYAANCSQEEIGLRGALRVARRYKPDMVIVTDVTHHTKTPDVDMRKHGEVICGKGAVILNGYNVNKNINKVIRETAEEKNIKYQILGDAGSGTDASMFAHQDIPVALIKIPNKYMHTTAEMVHLDDIEACISLMYETLINLNFEKLKFKTLYPDKV